MSQIASEFASFESLFPFLNAFDRSFDITLSFYEAYPRVVVVAALLLFFVVYYFTFAVKKPSIYCKQGKFRSFVTENCSEVRERYWPTLWCFHAHAQTVIASEIRSKLPDLTFNRELLTLPDGEPLYIDWYDGPRAVEDDINEDQRPIAVFVPGLTGDSNAEYIKTFGPPAHNLGYRVVVFNHRGLGGVKLKVPRLYCAANCDDLRFVLEYLRQKYPQRKIVATGVSLGGVLLCRYLVESSENSVVDAAMLVSVTFDFIAGYYSMRRPGLNTPFNRVLVKSLCKIVDDQRHLFEDSKLVDYDEVMRSKTLYQFDRSFIVKTWGISRPRQYYLESTNKGKLNRIKTPTLAINSYDDMFSPGPSLPYTESEESNYLCMVVTPRGGHIGFVDGFVPKLPFMAERLHEQYLKALLKVENIKKDLL